MSVKTVLHGTS